MSRLDEYTRYHTESTRVGDIDPSHAMLLYVCDRFELTTEQRYWLAWLYAMTYAGASVFYVYNEFPDAENVDIGRLQRWWDSRGRAEIICQTDRRWVRSSSMFVPAFESYRRWLGGRTQEEHFARFDQTTPEARYNALYRSAQCLHSFGQFALFLYLEALHTITPLELAPTDLDLSQAWSCRNGLVYAYELDQHLTEREMPTPEEAKIPVAVAWDDVRHRLAQATPGTNVWNIETTLCAYRKWRDGKRYIGSYLDRQATEIAKMEDHVRHGVCWDVLWQYRAEHLEKEYRAEDYDDRARIAKNGVHAKWREFQNQRTRELLTQ